jgi:hypothetical protein
MEKRYNQLPDKKKNAGCHMCHMKIYLLGVCITDLLGNLFVTKNLLDYAQELCQPEIIPKRSRGIFGIAHS